MGGHDHRPTPLKRVKRMKAKDQAGREDLSVEELVLSTFVSGGRQLMRLKLLHNLIGRLSIRDKAAAVINFTPAVVALDLHT